MELERWLEKMKRWVILNRKKSKQRHEDRKAYKVGYGMPYFRKKLFILMECIYPEFKKNKYKN